MTSVSPNLPEIMDCQRKTIPANSLLSLSNELLSLIVSICDPPELCALARTCHLLYEHTSPALYKSVVVNSMSTMLLLAFSCIVYGSRQAKQIQSFEAHLPWYRPEAPESKLVDVVRHMDDLQHLAIEYDLSKEYEDEEHRSFWIPRKLPSVLVSCTLNFKCFVRWPLEHALPLFLHPHLQELELHWAEATSDDISSAFSLYSSDSPTTQLRDLKLIDCQFSSDDLATLLRWPRALRTLSICSDLDANALAYDAEINHEAYFRAISESPSGKSLEGFRVDFLSRAWIIVPAPGMYRLQEVKYLEVNSEHLVYKAGDQELNMFQIPQIDCPLNRLLPPKLEVLKITRYDREGDEEFVLNILKQKSTLVPFLRKIILTENYRDEKMAQELKDTIANEEDGRSYAGALNVIIRGYPVYSNKKPMNAVEVHCKRSNVELMLLYEDSARKEILREGAGPAVWEIPEQIS